MAVVASVLALGLIGWATAGYGLGAVAQPTHHVLLIGDSLVWEADTYLIPDLTAHQRASVDTLVFGGTAPCDWLPKLPAELARFRPEAAVVEFSGDAFTPCMHDPVTGRPYSGPTLVAKYTSDVSQMMSLLERAHVTTYWASPPPFRSGALEPVELTALYRTLPFVWPHARFVDAGQSVTRNGAYTDYLPCLASEPCTAVDPATRAPAARVRAPDGVHFCPSGHPARAGITEPCATWSSGAWRYASTVAAPVIAQLHL